MDGAFQGAYWAGDESDGEEASKDRGEEQEEPCPKKYRAEARPVATPARAEALKRLASTSCLPTASETTEIPDREAMDEQAMAIAHHDVPPAPPAEVAFSSTGDIGPVINSTTHKREYMRLV